MAETLRIEIPIETIDETAAGLNSAIQGMKKLEQAYRNAGRSAGQAGGRVSEFDRRAERTERSLSRWAKEKYQILLEAKERITPVLSAIGGGIRSFAGKTWSVTMKAVDLVTKPVRGVLNLLKNPLFQAGAVLGVSIGLKDTVDTYKGFEAAMSQVEAISGATEAEMDSLTEKAKQMGATTKFTATESAQAFNYMAMAGWETKDMLGGIDGILNLAAASGTDLATTSDIVTDALTAFGMKADEAGHFADVLAAASSKSNTNVTLMGETFKYAGAMAGTLGYSVEDVALATGLMANAGIKGNMAGTALNSIFTRLSTNTNGAADAIRALGMEYFNADGSARDFGDVMRELREATADFTDKQKANLGNTVAGTYAQKGFLAILNATEEEYGKLSKAVNESDGAAGRMAETMMDNLAGSLTILQSALDGVKLSFGERLAPYVGGIAQWLTDSMPMLESALDSLMDGVDRRVEEMKREFGELVQTQEWQDADFFGKVKIAWDEFITEPFMEWWNGTGKAKLAEISGSIGRGIGSGLKAGILTLLGIDISSTMEEGASIGASFAKGFGEGFDFDAVSSKITEGLGNLVKNAGKLLPGGAAADLSSVFSAALLMKIASPFVGMGKGMFSLGKGLFGSASGKPSIASTLLGSAGAGTGLLGFGANTAISLGAGNLAGGASLSAGALSALGLGATTGGVAAGVSVFSGIVDLYHSAKSEDREEEAAYGKSGAWKIGGVGAGAGIGMAIGSVIPGLGTAVGGLIGAGVGGIAGWMKGNKVKEEYQKNVEEMQKEAEKAQKAFAATGLSIEDVAFKNEALTKAMNDSEVSASQFALMFQEACADVANDAFGDVNLSLEEIKDLAEKITFGKMEKSMERFQEAASQTAGSLYALKQSMANLDKSNWKVSLGMKLKKHEKESYKSSIDSFVEAAQSYIDDNHYEATVALKVIGGGKKDAALVDDIYGEWGTRLEEAGEELQRITDEALKDGVISDTDKIKVKKGVEFVLMDEASAIAEAQKQIADITNKLAEAKDEAALETMKMKYSIRFSGAGMDMESFTQMQQEFEIYTQEKAQTIEDAYISASVPLKLKLEEGGLSEEEAAKIKKQLEELQENYKEQMTGLDFEARTFSLNTLADVWGKELDGILPQMEGSTAEKLNQAMEQALFANPDAASWTQEDVKRWFGLDGLAEANGEAFEMLYEQLKRTALIIPEGTKEIIMQSFKEQIPSAQEIKDATNWEALDFISVDKLMESVIGTGSGKKTFQEFYGGGLGEAKEAYSHALQAALSESWSGALAEVIEWRPDSAEWDVSQIIECFQLGDMGLGEQEQESLAKLIQSVLDVPEGTKEEVIQNIKDHMPTAEEIKEAINWDTMTLEEWDTLLGTVTGSEATPEAQEAYFGDYFSKLKEACFTALQNSLSENPESFLTFMEGYMSETMAGLDFASVMEKCGPISDECYQKIIQEYASGLGTAFEGADLTIVGQNVIAGVGSAITGADMKNVNSAVDTLKSNTDASINKAFKTGVSTKMPVNITLDYNLLNPSRELTVSGNGVSGKTTVKVSANEKKGYASGGYVSGGPQLSWLAEEGYGEFVIPTNPSRRSRALELYRQAGEALGVSAHAEGGYVGNPAHGVAALGRALPGMAPGSRGGMMDFYLPGMANGASRSRQGYGQEPEGMFSYEAAKAAPTSHAEGTGEAIDAAPAQRLTGYGGNEGRAQVQVNVNLDVTPQFAIQDGGNGSQAELLGAITQHLGEMADVLGGEIAERLEKVFSNMPLKEA